MKAMHSYSSKGFQAKLNAFRSKNPEAIKAAVAGLGASAASDMIDLAEKHRDTNRFIRSLDQAHADLARIAGMSAPSPRPVRKSKRGAEIRERLDLAVQRALRQEQRLLGWAEANRRRADFNPSWPSHRKLLRDLDKAGDVTDRAIQALERFDQSSPEERESAVIIYGTKARRKNSSRVRVTTRNLDRAITRVFGGEGAARCEGQGGNTTAYATIASYEPHARIVDRKFRIGVRAMANIRRGTPLRTMNRNYLARLGKESGVSPEKAAGLNRSAA